MRFGLKICDAEQYSLLPDNYWKHFSLVKMPARLLGKKGLMKRFSRIVPVADNIAEINLCRLAPESAIRMQLEFAAGVGRCCREAAGAGAAAVTGNFDIERALCDVIYREQLLRLLRSMSPTMWELNCRMWLPVRLPSVQTAAAWQQVGGFFRELPGECFRALLEWHPHEAAFEGISGEILHSLRYYADAVEIVYEPGVGNKLTAALLARRLSEMGDYGSESDVFFYPAGAGNDLFVDEVAALTELAAELKLKG